jgi:hypothetical protein
MPSKSFSKRFALLVALNIKTINLKIGVMSPPGRHPGLIEWILEESSTGFRQNDIYFEGVPLPRRSSFCNWSSLWVYFLLPIS